MMLSLVEPLTTPSVTYTKTTVASHDFAGDTAAGSGLGTADTSQAWTVTGATWRRLAGKAQSSTDGTYATLNSNVADSYEVTALVQAAAASSFQAVIGRWKSVDDTYWAEVQDAVPNTGGALIKIKYKSGTNFIDLGVTTEKYLNVSGRLGLRFESDLIGLLVNDVVVLYVRNTQQVTPYGSSTGFRQGSSAAVTQQWGDFLVQTIVRDVSALVSGAVRRIGKRR